MTLKTLFRHGEVRLALVLSYYFMWYYALQRPLFDGHVVLRCVFGYLIFAVILAILLWAVTKLAGQPLFGATKLWFFPTKVALISALIISAVAAGLFALTSPVKWNALHLAVLIIGALGSVGAIVAYIYGLVHERKN